MIHKAIDVILTTSFSTEWSSRHFTPSLVCRFKFRCDFFDSSSETRQPSIHRCYSVCIFQYKRIKFVWYVVIQRLENLCPSCTSWHWTYPHTHALWLENILHINQQYFLYRHWSVCRAAVHTTVTRLACHFSVFSVIYSQSESGSWKGFFS